MDYKTLLVILHTSREKSEKFRGGGGGRAGLIANDRGNSFSFALRQQPLEKFFIRQGGGGVPVPLLLTYQTKSRVLIP